MTIQEVLIMATVEHQVQKIRERSEKVSCILLKLSAIKVQFRLYHLKFDSKGLKY